MDERVGLLAQVSELRRGMKTARSSVSQVEAGGSTSHQDLRSRLEREIAKRERELEGLERKIRGRSGVKVCWRDLRRVREEDSLLYGECLAFVQGALIQKHGIDGGIQQIADRLLEELSKRAGIPWGRLTVLADEEFTGYAAQIIRLRFPQDSIWSLPIAAHEFGHFIGPEIVSDVREGRYRGKDNPFRTMVRREFSKQEQQGAFLDEQFADIFATYSLGPSYACVCIILKFDPESASADEFVHPRDVNRAFMIFETLREMQRSGPPAERFDTFLDPLERVWNQSLAAAGTSPPDGDTAALLKKKVEKLFKLLESHLPASRYSSLTVARALKSDLGAGGPSQSPLTASFSDLLNAAWLRRLEIGETKPELVEELGSRAMSACQAVIKPRGNSSN